MKTRLLRKLRKEAKKKIYIVWGKTEITILPTYNLVRPEVTNVCLSLEHAKEALTLHRREYILNIVINEKLRKL